NRRRARVHDGVGGRDEGERARDHLVPRPDATGAKGELKGRAAVAGRDRMVRPRDPGEGGLESAHAGTLGQPAAAQDLDDGGLLLGAQQRSRDGDLGLDHDAAARSWARPQSGQRPPSCSRCPHSHTWPTTRPGLPTTNACGGTSRVTTVPAPISAKRPILTPGKTVQPPPMEAPSSTETPLTV